MGGSSNGTATVQAFYSLVALWRYEHDLPSLFDLSAKGTKAVPAKSPAADPSGNNNGSGSNAGVKNNGHNNGHNGSTDTADNQNGQSASNGQNGANSPDQTDQNPSSDGSADQGAESEGLVTADGSSFPQIPTAQTAERQDFLVATNPLP